MPGTLPAGSSRTPRPGGRTAPPDCRLGPAAFRPPRWTGMQRRQIAGFRAGAATVPGVSERAIEHPDGAGHRARAEALDAADPLAPFRDRFVLADPGLVY